FRERQDVTVDESTDQQCELPGRRTGNSWTAAPGGSRDPLGRGSADPDRVSGDAVDLGEVVPAQLQLGRGETGFDVCRLASPRNGHVHPWLCKHPGYGQLTDRCVPVTCELHQAVDDGEVVPQVLTLERGGLRTPVVGIEGGIGRQGTGEQSTGKRTVG